MHSPAVRRGKAQEGIWQDTQKFTLTNDHARASIVKVYARIYRLVYKEGLFINFTRKLSPHTINVPEMTARGSQKLNTVKPVYKDHIF